MQAINPATEEIVGQYADHAAAEVNRRLEGAVAAFASWRKIPVEDRAGRMKNLAAALRAGKTQFATTITLEMGKSIVEAEAEIEKCAVLCDYFAQHAPAMLEAKPAVSDARRSFVRYDPLGPVLAVMPWNFPFWQVFRFAVPALAAGNVGVLKHASNVPGCALAIERIFADASFPPGIFQCLLIPGAAIEAVIRHPAIQAVTLTGSEKAGMAVASVAGQCLKKTVMELGGSDPFIVLADADLEAAATAAAASRCLNCGQSCIAAKRFIVQSSIAEPFEQLLKAKMSVLKVGPGIVRTNQVGPLARREFRDSLDQQVRATLDAGAKLVCGGHTLPGRGFFYEPTMLTHVKPGMAAFDEETFGPVAAVSRVEDIEGAVRLANQTRYGLGASLWTRDLDRAEQLAAQLDAGSVFINGMVKSDPRLPFGGIKCSGWGRELAETGLREFTNVKTVWIK
jgi:succinate-semialdehyde dehydrogenase/glutarate-semialdehyde dehydrogenase